MYSILHSPSRYFSPIFDLNIRSNIYFDNLSRLFYFEIIKSIIYFTKSSSFKPLNGKLIYCLSEILYVEQLNINQI